MIVTTGIYVKNSHEAVALYMEAFGLKLGYHVKNPDGTFFHSELYEDEKELFSVVESPDNNTVDQTTQLCVRVENEAAVQKAFDLLREGGVVKTPMGPLPWSPCAAEVVDRFGVWWYITVPQHQPPDDYDPNAPWDPTMYKQP